LTGLLFVLPATVHAQTPRERLMLAASSRAEDPPPLLTTRSVAVGVGAIAGVAAFNAAIFGLGAFPGGLAYAAGATVPAEMAVAINRLYAVTTGVAGAWAGESLYTGSIEGDPSASERIMAAGLGAIAGVGAFGWLTAPLGSVPWAGAALDAMPAATMVGSRIIAVTTGGLGALAGNWLYDRATGEQSDQAYAWSLFGGALAGVALGNLLVAGQIGMPPYYIGAGLAEAGGAIATSAASAASRLVAVTSGAAGALAAHWLYNGSATEPADAAAR
jgi:hypothetical protein